MTHIVESSHVSTGGLHHFFTMAHIEIKIRELEQASVINLRSHSITTFNRYDRRIYARLQFLLLGRARSSYRTPHSAQPAASSYGSLALGESLTSLMTEHAHSRNVDLYMQPL